MFFRTNLHAFAIASTKNGHKLRTHTRVDCRRPLLVEDCQHYGRTCASLMMHCASFMMHNNTQCDFGNFEALADFLKGKNMVWKIFLGHFII